MSKALEVLKHYWNYNSFRPLQDAIIDNVLQGEDTFVLMPTGGGKSLCFQVPALILDGITLVISPLISLIKDQVGRLKKMHIQAEGLYSGMHAKNIHRILGNCTSGKIKMLYLSPERLSSPLFLEYLDRLNVSMIVVDEAHCISQWGYDFRPSYLNISTTIKSTGRPIVMALTASATKQVVLDIRENLNIQKAKLFQVSFFRNNLTYVARRALDKRSEILNLLNNVKGSGIIYVRSRRATSEVSTYLNTHKVSAANYHAGLNSDVLSKIQDEWMSGKIRVMVATSAFGMGIDKPDVRFVIHLAIPSSIEEYYQEAGRGGRDGNKSYAAIFYDDTDIDNLLESIESSFPSAEELIKVYFQLANYFQVGSGEHSGEFQDFNMYDFCKKYDYKVIWLVKALKELETQNYIHVTEGIYVPDQVMINYNKVELYDFQLRNPEYDSLIETLLRMYGGILNMPVKINIGLISKKLKTEEVIIIKMLEYLDLAGVLDFEKQKENPQISFGQFRYNAQELSFNFELQQFLKQRYKEKVHAILTFVESPLCRNRTLLDYFGEEFVSDCGICDICIENKQNRIPQKEVDECIEYVINFANGEDNSSSNLVRAPFFKKNKVSVQIALQFLLNENKIEFENYRIKIKH